MKHILHYLQAVTLALVLMFTTTACHDNNGNDIPEGYGTVVFELIRYNVYTVANLTEAKTIKVVLVDEKANHIELPSMQLSGNEDRLSTPEYALPAGHYLVQSFRCFDKNADLIEDLDVTMYQENTFDITAGDVTTMGLTIQVKKVLSLSNVYNALYGLCLEAIGSDKSKWPPSWDFDGEGIDGSWAGLEFEWDVATNTPSELTNIIIDGDEVYEINSDTWERRLVSLPEFRHMTRLPGCIANLQKLDGLVVRNCDMETIDPNLKTSPITSLSITNTHLRAIPEELGELRELCSVELADNRLQSFPTAFTRCEKLNEFILRGEPGVTSVPESIGNWGSKLLVLNISGTGISSLPDVFDRLWHVYTLELSDNPRLSTLPKSVGLSQIPYDGGGYTPTAISGVVLDGCGFTEIPEAIKRPRMIYVSMRNNHITSVTKADFDPMTDLEYLALDGNQLTSFPALTNPRLSYLSLMGCGLRRDQVDISGLPSLKPNYFYCE